MSFLDGLAAEEEDFFILDGVTSERPMEREADGPFGLGFKGPSAKGFLKLSEGSLRSCGWKRLSEKCPGGESSISIG